MTNAPRRRPLAAVLCLTLASAASGCSTYSRHARYFRGDYDDRDRSVCQVYAGSLKDPLVQVVGLIDLPLCLAADSALLPVAIGETVELSLRRRRDRADGQQRPPRDDAP